MTVFVTHNRVKLALHTLRAADGPALLHLHALGDRSPATDHVRVVSDPTQKIPGKPFVRRRHARINISENITGRERRLRRDRVAKSDLVMERIRESTPGMRPKKKLLGLGLLVLRPVVFADVSIGIF